MIIVYIAVGGALGALARYGLGSWVQSWAGATFPWGTLAVNVVGSLALGFALRFLAAAHAGAGIRAFVAVGFCGAFTTFSTFSYETVALLQSGEWLRAAAYAAGSVAAGIVSVLLGFALAGMVKGVAGGA